MRVMRPYSPPRLYTCIQYQRAGLLYTCIQYQRADYWAAV